MAAHYHVALGRTLTNNDARRSATSNPRLGGMKSMRANRHHYAPKSLDSRRSKPERETQPEGAQDNSPYVLRCRPNRPECTDHAASARPREYGELIQPHALRLAPEPPSSLPPRPQDRRRQHRGVVNGTCAATVLQREACPPPCHVKRFGNGCLLRLSFGSLIVVWLCSCILAVRLISR